MFKFILDGEYCQSSPLVYDKIGNVLNEMSANKNFSTNATRSLLSHPPSQQIQTTQPQPLKSFSINYNTSNNTTTSSLLTSPLNHQHHNQPSSPTQLPQTTTLNLPKTPNHGHLKSPNRNMLNNNNHNNRNQLNLLNINKTLSIEPSYNTKLIEEFYDQV